MLVYHLPYPAGDAESLKKVVVSSIFQLCPVSISLWEVRQPSDLCFGTIGIVTNEIIDLELEMHLSLGV